MVGSFPCWSGHDERCALAGEKDHTAMKRAAYYAVALLAELLSWLPLAIGFVVGVCVAALIVGYGLGREAISPAVSLPPAFEEDDDGD